MDVGDGAFDLTTHGVMPPLVVGILGGWHHKIFMTPVIGFFVAIREELKGETQMN